MDIDFIMMKDMIMMNQWLQDYSISIDPSIFCTSSGKIFDRK